MQDDGQQGSVYQETAVVLDETQFAEFVDERIDASARSADHLRQRFLLHFEKFHFGVAGLAVMGEQQQRAGQPLLAGIEELVN